MKKLVTVVLSALIFVMMNFAAVGCAPPGGDDIEEIDTDKTQLYVFNFDGGYGTEWLRKAKERFEALYAEKPYEEGKKGVQIVISPLKKILDGVKNNILTNKEEIYFTEYAYYNTLRAEGLLGDITPAVIGDLEEFGDEKGTTIESKLTDEHKDYLRVQEDGESHYYGIPHYAGYMGITYNVDLFTQYGAYLREKPVDGTLEGKFLFRTPGAKKSAGPDGVPGNMDDGLPRTYSEFYDLCEYLSKRGVTPLNWTGKDYKAYLTWFHAALAAQNDGLTETMRLYTQAGSAANLGTIENGVFVKDAAPTDIHSGNGYEMFRSEGRYRAYEFLEKIVTTTTYRYDKAFSSTQDILTAQDTLIKTGMPGEPVIGMLIDGAWWESEATESFDELVAAGNEDRAKDKMNFAFMPLPKADEMADDNKLTLFDQMYSMCFMKSNVAEWKKPLIYDFIKFINSNESLMEFTEITGVPKALKYNVTDMSSMTTYAKSLIQLKQSADIVYPFSGTELYLQNQGAFAPEQLCWFTASNGQKIQYPAEKMHDESRTTAEDIFSGNYAYWKDNWAKLQK